MSKGVKTIVGIVAFVVGFIVVGGIIALNSNSNSGMSSNATFNSNKNAFISGCEKNYTTDDQTDIGSTASVYCTCAYNSINKYEISINNSDWDTNTDKMQTILDNGYTQGMTDAITGCISN